MKRYAPLSLLLPALLTARALDLNGNQQSDVWESNFGAAGLAAGADSDGDGASNAQESVAGTHPLSAASKPEIKLTLSNGVLRARWSGVAGKRYTVEARGQPGAGTYGAIGSGIGVEGWMELPLQPGTNQQQVLRLAIADADVDGDALSDAEEALLGLDAASAHSERYDDTDGARVASGWNTASAVSVAVLDGELREDWPDGAVIALRRTGGWKAITVPFTLTGSATAGADYTPTLSGSAFFRPGQREVFIELKPLTDALTEGAETITLTAQTGSGYSLVAGSTSASVTLQDADATHPGAKEAARFLIQAAFGPDQDDPADADVLPENVEALMASSITAWIDDQFTRPVGYHKPMTDWIQTQSGVYWEPKRTAWWDRIMGVPSLAPGQAAQAPDPLRQRMAFALSQILVVSDRPEALAVDYSGMAHYYDVLVAHAFGNYRTLLFEVARHPVMGHYLSHVKNRKPDPVLNIHPDENFAREIMQLFTIGLWQLNMDGTRKLTPQGDPIPTYGIPDVTELARVFTGFSYDQPGNDSFENAYNTFNVPMQMWDAYHDTGAKTLLGSSLPARTASANPDTGTAGLQDVNAAIDVLFNHPNVAPFVSRQLIQRFVTSNPSPAYVGRVAAVFANNGQGVRGDLKAVVRALLLDVEARDPAYREAEHAGRMREPLLAVANLAYALKATAPNGHYAINNLDDLISQEAHHSPSVFNFFKPGYSPPGAVLEAGRVAPEFQILNSATAISTPNYWWHAITEDFTRWGAGSANDAVKINLAAELNYAADAQLDTLLRRLDLALTGGCLQPRQLQSIRETLLRIETYRYQWDRERVYVAIYTILNSPDFAILR